ncbi:uncharacterized protein LOC112086250 [Eutrema salsugineum]|uniref:uncharacterized protein LOC112086250 n=1 Tax=Eutrema salsugineum TaxID=72664 RepID=UPI000CED4E7D|nr:uncharacterized protein LOC112086250 [Eutrema salsugineum]
MSLIGEDLIARLYDNPVPDPMLQTPTEETHPVCVRVQSGDKGKGVMTEQGIHSREVGGSSRPSRAFLASNSYPLGTFGNDAVSNSSHLPTTRTLNANTTQFTYPPMSLSGDSFIMLHTPSVGGETRVKPALHERDAPPYFDYPMAGADAIARGLRDAQYEGDDIYVGRIFKTKDDCKLKLAIHAINRRYHFKTVNSQPENVIVVCVGPTCPWRIYAVQMEDNMRFEVRTVNSNHTCSVDARGDFHRVASTEVIGKMVHERYGLNIKGPRACDLRRLLRQEYSLHVSYWKAWRAREIAIDNTLGGAAAIFALVTPYFEKILTSNPNSVVALETETSASGVGYQYMRKVIVIDATHLSGRYGGCLMAASAQDGNFQVFPIGFGIVNSENDDSWEWFLRKLTAIVPDEHDLVFVSDRHASIYAAIRKVYLMSSHGACIVHLQRNVVTNFKSDHLSHLTSVAARAYRFSDFEKAFMEIKALDERCAEYLQRIGFEHWTRSHFVGERYNVMTSNISESLNKVMTMVREYPIISILETIRTTLVSWFAIRRESANTETDVVNPKIQEMLIESFHKPSGYFVMKIGNGLYEVRDKMDTAFAVSLWEQTCSCKEFQLLHIPCFHAIAAALKEGVRVDNLVDIHYTTQYRKLAYSKVIMPVPDMDHLAPRPDDIGGGKLAPPAVRRPPGRPRKQRILSQGEFKRVSRRKCTRCRGRGHNRSTCKTPLPGE